MTPDEILTAAGIPGGETYWPEQPRKTFSAWGEEIEADGSDYDNKIRTHNITIELYELMDAPDPQAHTALQDALDDEALRWRKQPREVDLTLRLYMTIYTYSFLTRR